MLWETILLLQILIGNATASAPGTGRVMLPTAICYNNATSPWLTQAVMHAQQSYVRAAPWRNNFIIVDSHTNERLCQLAKSRYYSYFYFTDNVPHQPAYTVLSNMRPQFEVVIDLKAASTPETLHLLLLHEIGHVYGLDHISNPSTVMGYALQATDITQQQYFQEINFFRLTTLDLEELIRTEPNTRHVEELQALARAAPPTLSVQRIKKCV